MNINNLNTYPTNQLSKQKFSCRCGETHEISSNIAFDDVENTIEHYIEKIVPPLSLISILYDLSSRQKYERTIDKKLGNFGFRVNPQVCKQGEKIAQKISEDTRLILGVGNHRHLNEVKQLAFLLNLPYALVPTCPSSHLQSLIPSYQKSDQGCIEIFKSPPPNLLLCENDWKGNTPQAGSYFSLISAKLVSLFDYQASASLNGEKFCFEIFDQALSIIDESIEQTLGATNQFELERILKENLVRYGALCQLKGNTRLALGAETLAAKIFSSLTYYNGDNIGENEFLFARILMRLYLNYLENKTEFFTPPPSNNKRVQLISKYFKIPEQIALKNIRPVPNAHKESLSSYKLKIHRDELFALATEFDSKLTLAYSALKKLYLDEGYSFTNYLGKNEATISVALAPDFMQKFTLLSFMKDRGLLEGMLNDS
ncbi:MAG: hypothetical protein FWC11_04170 [Firmicutes bacterium]|nr:hypothetical protein [Bacillota bacterium]MCL2256038.1 hypothetical protein [Bacillota bacterium]